MFGTELTLTTVIITLIEICVLSFQCINYLSRRDDKSRLRFLILILLFITYNLASGLLPDESFHLNLLLQYSISYGSGIVLVMYYYYYLVQEFSIIQDRTFNVKTFIISVAATFLLIFVIGGLMTNDIQLAKQVFIIFPMGIALYFCVRTVIFLVKKRKELTSDKNFNALMITCGYLGILFMASMPIVVFFGNYQTLNISLVNFSFFLICFAYVKRHIDQSNIEYEMIQNIREKTTELEGFPHYLTPKELEISYLILLDLNYHEIADFLYISNKTVSKHASNIFKKAHCKNKIEYVNQFSMEIRKINDAIADISN